MLGTLEAVEEYLRRSGDLPSEVAAAEALPSIETARGVKEQDAQEESADGSAAFLCRSAARERVISVEDTQMRHGRKSRSVRFDGYERHVLKDLDPGPVRAVGTTRANAPEASVTRSIIRRSPSSPTPSSPSRT